MDLPLLAQIYLKEEDVLNGYEENKIVIVSDIAGMGKSIVFTNLSLKLKDLERPNLWILNIDLNKYSSLFYKMLKNQQLKTLDLDLATEFLVNDFLPSVRETKFKYAMEKELFKANLRTTGRLVLFFEGFDEISPEYKDFVIDLLKVLKESKVQKMFISTRPQTRSELEEKLGVFSYKLELLSEENQIEFLTKFWKRNLSLNDECQKYNQRLQDYAKIVIDSFTSSINDSEKTFAGIPLHIHIIAEYFLRNGIQSCQDYENQELVLPTKLHELYQTFVHRKYEICEFEKGQAGTGNTSIIFLYRSFREKAQKQYQLLAIKMLFNTNAADFNTLQNVLQISNDVEDNENEYISKYGIVTFINRKLHFIHRAYAEYFAAVAFCNILQGNVDHSVRNILKDYVSKSQYMVLKTLMEYMMVQS